MADTNRIIPEIPENMPRFGNSFTRGIGLSILRLMGWRVVGEFPNIRKTVFAAGPHTSNWDFIIAMAVVLGGGIKISYLMKREAFFWPFKGLFIALGGIPIDRGSASETVNQAAQSFQNHDKLWLAITPEGTRNRVDKWKTGFLRIAHEAELPICLVAWDYPNKSLIIEKLWYASGDFEGDAEEIKNYICGQYQGRHPQRQ